MSKVFVIPSVANVKSNRSVVIPSVVPAGHGVEGSASTHRLQKRLAALTRGPLQNSRRSLSLPVPRLRCFAPTLGMTRLVPVLAALMMVATLRPLQAKTTPHPSCAFPNRQAYILTRAEPSDYPGVEFIPSGTPERATVRVMISSRGTLIDAQIIRRSGNLATDRYALQVARESKYAPKLQTCIPVKSSFTFVVNYYPPYP